MVKQLLRTAMQKPVTRNYPAHKEAPALSLRGKIKFDLKLCVGCKLCMRDCPCQALVIKKEEAGVIIELDLGRCIYCGQCVDSCLRKAISLTTDFELAQLTAEALKLTFHAKP